MKKVALITGASSGIGREMAKIHARNGGDLIIVARSELNLESLKVELESTYDIKVVVLAKDLTERTAAAEIHQYTEKHGIEVEFLINNAGFGGQGKFHERDWEADLAMINLNIVALTELTRLYLPEFVSRDNGKILNVSSTASLMPGPLQAVYFATKAYVTSFSNALTEEIADTNVTVTTLLPGATETEFAKTSGMDKTGLFEKTFSAEEVASLGYNGMLSGKLNVLAGLTFGQKMMMKMLPFMPKRMILKQIKKSQEVR